MKVKVTLEGEIQADDIIRLFERFLSDTINSYEIEFNSFAIIKA